MITGEGNIDTAKEADKRPKGVITIIIVTIEYRDNYSKTTGSCLQFCRYEPNATTRDSESFKFNLNQQQK